MKKINRLLSLLISMTMLISCFNTIPVTVNAQDGDIITISTALELAAFRDEVNSGNTYEGKTVMLTADIDLVGSESNQWTPIGIDGKPFNGTFDGGNHQITGLYINCTDDYQGFFGYLEDNGEVKNLGVDGTASGGDYVGGVVGYSDGKITYCYNSGTVTGNYYVGGVVGVNYGEVTCCYNTGKVTGNGSNVGGVVGVNYGEVTCCYNTGKVTGNGSNVGGVVGTNQGAVTNSYNTGEVVNVNGIEYYVGGVTGVNGVGSTVTNCYYLDTCGVTDSEGEQKTAEEFKVKSTFNNWDFETIWKMSESHGRPIFIALPEAEPPHNHSVCGKTCTHDTPHTEVEWTLLTQEMIDNEKTQIYNLAAGNYYLIENIVTDKEFSVGTSNADRADVNICFNGHTITCSYNESGSLGQIYVYRNSSLTVCDCKGDGGFSSAEDVTIPLFDIAGALNLYSGTLSGAIPLIDVNGSLMLDGGTIEIVKSSMTVSGAINIKSGSITSDGSCTIDIDTSVFNMTGGTVKNTKTSGETYAISSYNGGMISGGSVISAGTNGSAIFLAGSVPVVLSGSPELKGNRSDIIFNDANCKLNVIGLNPDVEYTVNCDNTSAITETMPYTFTVADSKDNIKHFKASSELSNANFAIRNVGKDNNQTVQIYKKHNLTHYYAKAATCTENGNAEYWQCSNPECKKYFSDENGTTEIESVPIINQTGHNWGAWKITTEPTNTAAGQAERICTKNSAHKETITLPVLTDTDVWTLGTRVEPTEDRDGSQQYTSEYGSVTVTIPALGHTHEWGAWKITTEPTLTTTGVAERVCKDNNAHKETITLSALTDTDVWTKGEKVEPTEDRDGSQEYTSEYGTVTITIPKLTDDTLPNTGDVHDMNMWIALLFIAAGAFGVTLHLGRKKKESLLKM